MGTNMERQFLKYLQGTLTENEEANLVDWINLSEKNFSFFKQYISENQYSQYHSAETNAAWSRIKQKLHVQQNHRKQAKVVLINWFKVAAIITIAFIAGVLAKTVNLGVPNDYGYSEIIVPKGEKSHLILPDGSKVYLNSDSYLKYPAVFTKSERKVVLVGEAFFEIAKDQSHPFIVETKKFNVKVTGTSFNLSAYDNDLESSVTLHTGKVVIEKNGFRCNIAPGDKYIFNNSTYKYKVEKANIEESGTWKRGVVFIDDMTLDEIVKILSREFNVSINLADENLKSIKYTGQTKPHETLEDILTLIKDASPVKFKIEFNKTKDHVIIKSI